VFDGHGHVADRDHAHAAAVGLAVDRADQGLRQIVQRAEHARELARLGDALRAVGRELFLHPAQIAAGAKALARSRQHDRPDGVVARQLVGGGVQFGDHARVERIVFPGQVQRQRGDAAIIDLQRDGFPGHCRPPAHTLPCRRAAVHAPMPERLGKAGPAHPRPARSLSDARTPQAHF